MLKHDFMKLSRISLALVAFCGILSCTNPKITFTWEDDEAFAHKAWKGERLFAQAVLETPEDLTDVTVRPTVLWSGLRVIDASCVQAQFTRQVMSDVLQDGYRQCGRRAPGQFDSLLVADLIDTVRRVDVAGGSVQTVWVTVEVPRDAKPGIYRGEISLRGTGMVRRRLPLEFEVVDRELPEPSEWKFHLDLWQNPYSVARYHAVELWSEEHFELMEPVMRRLADAGQKVITTTILNRPWNGQTEDAYGSMVRKIRKADGKWEYDYSVFDKWVSFMMDIGIDDYISCYSMIPWKLEFDYFDEATGRDTTFVAAASSKEYKLYWGRFLSDFAAHLRSKGWFEKTIIAMDERPAKAMLAAFETIFTADPDFKVSLAGNWHPELERDLFDYCVGFRQGTPAEVVKKRQGEGRISTWYTCCAERFPNSFMVSPLEEGVWIGWRTLAAGYDGYLRWSYNHWTKDPVADARFRTWPAGDCYFVYPGGRSSRRFDRIVEGIQDYEKARILMAEWKAAGDTLKLQTMQQALNKFTYETLESEGAAPAVRLAKSALDQ